MKYRRKKIEAFNDILNNHHRINIFNHRIEDLDVLIDDPWLQFKKGKLRDGRKADKFLLKREKLPQDLG